MKLKRFFYALFATVYITGCVEVPDDFVAPTWDVQIHIPVTKKEYTLKEAIEKDTTFVKWYTDSQNAGMLYFSKEQPIETISLDNNLAVNGFSSSFSQVIGSVSLDFPAAIQTGIYVEDWTTNVTSGSTQVFPEQEGNVAIGFKGYDKIQHATFEQGQLSITMFNNLPVPITIRGFEIRNADDKAVIGKRSNAVSDWIDIPPLTQWTVDTPFDLSGKTVSDTLEFAGIIYSTGSNGDSVVIPSEAGTQVLAEFSNLVISSATAPLPQQTFSFENSIVFDDSTKLETAIIKEGSVRIVVNNNIGVDLTADVSIANLFDLNNNPYHLNVNLAKYEQNKVIEIPSLAGWRIGAEGSQLTNEFQYAVNVSTVATDEPVTVSKNDSISFNFEFGRLEFESVKGQLKPTLFALQPSQFEFDLGDFKNSFLFSEINFDKAELSMQLNTSANLEVQVDGNISSSNGTQTNSVALENVLIPSSEPVLLDLAPLLNGFSSQLPNVFTVSGSALVNPNYKIGSVSVYDSVYGNVSFEIPLNVGIKGGKFVDTVEVNLGDISDEDIDKINYGKVYITLTNEIPVSLSFTGKVVDDGYNQVLKLPPLYNSITQISVPAPEVNNSGDVINAGTITEEIELKGEDMKKFLHNPFIIVNFDFETPGENAQPVKFNIAEKISFSIKAEAGYKVDL